jgi:20S proteasome subunit alpha 5
VALLVAGWDPYTGPVLYHTDPSGMFVEYDAKAMGSGSEGAQTALQEEYKKDLTLKEAEVLALSTLKQVMEEKVGCLHSSLCH